MRELADFLRFVLPYAQACPEPIAEQHLRAAAREFCEATRCWREADTIPVRGDEIEILCIPPHATLFELESAAFDGQPLCRIQYQDADIDALGQPRAIFQRQPNTVSLSPRGPGSLTVSMFLKPSQDADVLPLFLYEQWAEQIGYGALARILELPEQPYSDPNGAARNRALFERAKDSNFNASVRGQHRAPTRSRSRFL